MFTIRCGDTCEKKFNILLNNLIMEDVKKQTPVDLYLMVPHSTFDGEKEVTKICLLSCKKLKTLVGITPTKEILTTHFEAERVKIEIAKRDSGKENTYVPQPLVLELKSSIFASIVEEARAKDRKLGNPLTLALTLGNTMPCCLLMPEQEKKEEAEAPKPKQVRKKRTKKIVEEHD